MYHHSLRDPHLHCFLSEEEGAWAVHFRAVALVIGWFALLFVALWSEIAGVAALQRAMKQATFLHNSPPGRDVESFRW